MDEKEQLRAFIVTDDYQCHDGYINLLTCNSPEVIPETVGQYTGLKDKNGEKIYEGDIVTEYDYPFIDEDGKQNYIGIVQFYEEVAQFGFTFKCVNKNKRGISNGFIEEFEANSNLICEDLEIIGNIYDDPELLGGTNERY